MGLQPCTSACARGARSEIERPNVSQRSRVELVFRSAALFAKRVGRFQRHARARRQCATSPRPPLLSFLERRAPVGRRTARARPTPTPAANMFSASPGLQPGQALAGRGWPAPATILVVGRSNRIFRLPFHRPVSLLRRARRRRIPPRLPSPDDVRGGEERRAEMLPATGQAPPAPPKKRRPGLLEVRTGIRACARRACVGLNSRSGDVAA